MKKNNEEIKERLLKARALSDEELVQVVGGGGRASEASSVSDGNCGHNVALLRGKCTCKTNDQSAIGLTDICIGCKYAWYAVGNGQDHSLQYKEKKQKKIKEELNALKEEVEIVWGRRHELTEDELEQVTGGKYVPHAVERPAL